MPTIQYDCPSGPLPAYLAVPSGDGPWPGVVVVHDGFGLTDDIQRITDRLAENGYLAMAPALFRRGRKLLCVVSTFRALLHGSGPAIGDLIAARHYLFSHRDCTGKVGIVGFCMGGGFCLVLAPRGIFNVAAPNYGDWPKDVGALAKSCPMVASYGARDPLLRSAAAKLEALLAEGGVPRDIKEYPNVGHSFMNDWGTYAALQPLERLLRFAYSEPEAEDAWRRILAFFETHLK